MVIEKIVRNCYIKGLIWKKHLSQQSTRGYILTTGEFFIGERVCLTLAWLIKPRPSNIKIMFELKN